MAKLSVANSAPDVSPENTAHTLWLGAANPLEMSICKNSGCPPEIGHIYGINWMIQGLARAASAVVSQANDDDDGDPAAFQMQPIGAIADAIMMLSQLSDAVHYELTRTNANVD